MSTAAQALPRFKVTKHVTLPLLKLGAEPAYVRFEGAIYQSEKSTPTRPRADGAEPKVDKKAPPMLAEVTDMVRRIRCQIIVNTVLESELTKKYKDNSYVGKTFRLVKTQLQGRDYATFEITEGELETDDQETAPKGKK